MKKRVVTAARWALRAAIGLAGLVVLLVVLLHFGWFINLCVLPIVHGASPVRIEFARWRLRIFTSLTVEKLKVRQISADGRETNVVAEARSLIVRYRFWSLFGNHPVFKSVEAVDPAIGLAGMEPAESGSAERKPGKGTTSTEPAEREAMRLPVIPLPVTIGRLSIRNGLASYTDASGLRMSVRRLDMDAIDIAPGGTASINLSAMLTLNDGKDISVSRLPVTLSGSAVLGDTVIPENLKLVFAVSNVVGRASGVDLAPLACVLNFGTRQTPAGAIDITACNARVDWLDAVLGSMTITGQVDLVADSADTSGTLAISPSPFWQVFLGKDSPVDVRKTSVDAAFALHTRLTSQKIDASCTVAVRNVSLATDEDTAPIPPTDFDTAFVAQFSGTDKTLEVPELTASVTQRNVPVLSLRTEAPVRLCWSDRAALRKALNERAAINLSLKKFPLSQLNALLGDTEARFAAGTVSLDVAMDVREMGRQMGVRGTLGVVDVDMALGKARWRDIDVSANMDAGIADFRSLTLGNNVLNLFLDNTAAGQIAMGGYADLKGGSNRLALVVAKFRSEVLQRLIDPDRKNKRLEGLDLTLQMLAQKTEVLRAAQDISLTFTVDNRFRPQPGEWQRLSLDAAAAAQPGVVRFKRCNLTLAPGIWQDNSIQMSGAVFIEPTNLVGALTIASRHFDATTLCDTFLPSNAPPPKLVVQPLRQPGKSKEPRENIEPRPLAMARRSYAVDVRFDELRAREMVLKPCFLDVRLISNVFTIASRGLGLNDGAVEIAAQADLGVTGFVYAARVTATNVPLMPIINSWVPKRKDMVDGMMEGVATINGRGITMPSLKQHLNGDIDAWLRDGYLYHNPILEDVGKALHIEALREFNFGDGRIDLTVSNGFVLVNTVALHGAPAKIDARGWVDFDQTIDVDMFLSLNAKLIPDLVGLKVPGLESPTGYVELPVPIPIHGSLTNRSVGISYQDIVPHLLKALGKTPTDLIKGLFNTAPDNKVSKGINDGIKVLEDFLNPKPRKKE